MEKHSLTSNDSLVSLVQRVVRLASQVAEAELKAMNLTLQEFRVLGCLVGESGINQSELAKRMSIKPATLSVVVNRLEKRDMLRRIVDPEDQRQRLLSLPDDFDFAPSNQLLRDIEKKMCKNIGEEKQQLVGTILTQMAENLFDHL